MVFEENMLCVPRIIAERTALRQAVFQKKKMPANAVFTGIVWRRWWDSNPRIGCPINAFRVRPVMTTSIHLRA